MRLVARSIALAVVVSLVVSGPLATFARAEEPAEQPLQEAVQQSSEGSAEEPAQQPGEAPQLTVERMRARGTLIESAWYNLGAIVANVVFVPGKAVTCGLGAFVGGSLLILTLGAAYKGAVAFGKEGCGGKWFLTGNDLRGTDYILAPLPPPERY